MTKTNRVILSALVISLLLGGAALAGGAPTIGWSVIGGGGGHAATGRVALDSVIGQWVAGGATGGATQIEGGFLTGSVPAYDRYLPLVMRR